MNGDERAKFVEGFLKNVAHAMKAKGEDYKVAGAGGDEDVNGNFKRVAAEVGLRPVQVWYTHFSKHLDAIRNYIRQERLETEPIEGRISDSIAYLAILASMIDEERRGRIGHKTASAASAEAQDMLNVHMAQTRKRVEGKVYGIIESTVEEGEEE